MAAHGADTNAFYRRTLHVLSDAQIPYLVGGSHAFLHYTGIVRDTKDLDVFVRRADCDRACSALDNAGYRTEVTFAHWLAKAIDGDDFVDLVFASGNGVARVDNGWFDHAVEAQVLGMPVKLVPAEELIWQKAFVMERERFDGADILHILHEQAGRLDWTRLVARFGEHGDLLLVYCVLFGFVYPAQRDRIPSPVLDGLLARRSAAVGEGDVEGLAAVCRGTLLSRSQFLPDIGRWGYRDARVAPTGTMTTEEVTYWTWAIDHVK
ncbi:MAG: hypothetical protein NVS1B4_15060 [Gemmatimonadaceae bacterium]